MDISARKIKDFSVIMVEAVDFVQANKARNLVSWTDNHAAKRPHKYRPSSCTSRWDHSVVRQLFLLLTAVYFCGCKVVTEQNFQLKKLLSLLSWWWRKKGLWEVSNRKTWFSGFTYSFARASFLVNTVSQKPFSAVAFSVYSFFPSSSSWVVFWFLPSTASCRLRNRAVH